MASALHLLGMRAVHEHDHAPPAICLLPRSPCSRTPFTTALESSVLKNQVDTFFDSYVSGLQNEAQDAVAEQSPFGSGAFGKHQVVAHFSVTQCLGALYAGTMRARPASYQRPGLHVWLPQHRCTCIRID